MLKWQLAVAGAMALLFAAACSTDNPNSPLRLGPTSRPAFSQVNGAGFTSVDPAEDGGALDGTDQCKNGNPLINCNIYTDKQFVWLNGGPASAAIGGDGNYLFAVLAPGGQGANDNPNDGTPKNLSDQTAAPWNAGDVNADGSSIPSGDSYLNRVFNVATAGAVTAVTYAGTHTFDQPNGKIRLMPYDDTPNHGGVYIMAICAVGDAIHGDADHPDAITGYTGYPVDPSTCKYDAFKIVTGGGTPGAEILTVSKNGTGGYTTTYAWSIVKDASPVHTEQVGGTVQITYNVTISRDPAHDAISSVTVTGKITVTNPNPANVQHVTVTDALAGAVCTVTGGSDVTVGPGDTQFDYSCSLSAVPTTDITNTATANWPAQSLSVGDLPAGPANFDLVIHPTDFSQTGSVNATINVTDAFNGNSAVPIGTLLSPTGASTVTLAEAPKTFTYYRSVAVPAHDCVTYSNTAAITETGQSDDASVEVCGPGNTGALTIGFWKGPNGNSLIQNYCTGGTGLGAYLKGLGAGAGPFSNAPTTCSSLVTYVNGIISGASSTNMNTMLKAQMLATALDVWFSGPGWSSTATGKIKPPSTFLSHNSLGTFNMDMTAICPMVDNTTTGTATCSGGKPSTDAVASGAVLTSPMAMQAVLNFAATAPAPFTGSATASTWYGTDRTKQEILKNIFDQFNNGLAFGAF